MRRTKKYLALFAAILALSSVFLAFFWPSVSAGDRDDKESKHREPFAQGAHFHITGADGTKTVHQLILEQATDLRPGSGVVCRLYIANSSNHAEITLPTAPGHDPLFGFTIGRGQMFDFPITRQQDVALEEIPIRTEGVANAYFYWEFCR